MKSSAKEYEELPAPSDLKEWRRLVADGELRPVRPELIVAAIQHIGPNGDQRLLNSLVGRVSDVIMKMLRSRIGGNHRNDGNDLIERAHAHLIVAALNPDCADGKGMRTAFRARVNFRADDAIVFEQLELQRYEAYATDSSGETIEPRDTVPADNVEQLAHVEHVLAKISDPKKRLAFRLHMDECPLAPGKGTCSISEALGVSAKTAGKWISEVQTFLMREGAIHE